MYECTEGLHAIAHVHIHRHVLRHMQHTFTFSHIQAYTDRLTPVDVLQVFTQSHLHTLIDMC